MSTSITECGTKCSTSQRKKATHDGLSTPSELIVKHFAVPTGMDSLFQCCRAPSLSTETFAWPFVISSAGAKVSPQRHISTASIRVGSGQMEHDYDLVVVGRGLVGSAAAKHALQHTPSLRVALVGPSEESQPEVGVYGCHADEGRITRSLDTDAVWAELAARSMHRYAEIEEESGVRFHSATGCLAVGRANGPYLSAIAETAARRGVSLEYLDAEALTTRWPALRLDASLLRDGEAAYAGLYEQGTAGNVSPRRLLEAQLVIFRQKGGIVLDDVVDSIQNTAVMCAAHGVITSRKVLVATNAWTNFRNLLPRRVKLILTTQTTVRRRVAASLRDMPSLIVKGGDSPFGATSSTLDAFYALPPIVYDGGDKFVKIGHGTYFEKPLDTQADARAWYDSGHDDDASSQLSDLLVRLFREDRATLEPDVPVRCVIPKTPTKRPYLHRFSPTLACAVGCNGYAAKSSDELGRLAAAMILRDNDPSLPWGPNIPPDAFRVVFEDDLEVDDEAPV